MNFDLLLSTWRDSLALFSWSQIKLCLLGTVATWLRSMTIMFRLFWWLIVGLFALGYWCPFGWSRFVVFMMWLVLLYLIMLSVRPSLERKDYFYFGHYILRIWAIGVVLILFKYCGVTQILLAWLLFYFDSNGSLNAVVSTLKATFKMYLFFLPFFAVLSLVAFILGYFYSWLMGFFDIPLLKTFFSLVISLFVCSVLSVYYIKLKHQHYKLIFE